MARLEAIEASLNEADAGVVFDDMFDQLRSAVIPNLVHFQRVGRRYLGNPPRSVEALRQLATNHRDVADSIRAYLHGDYLIRYIVAYELATVYLLTIRHHQHWSSDFAGFWLVETEHIEPV